EGTRRRALASVHHRPRGPRHGRPGRGAPRLAASGRLESAERRPLANRHLGAGDGYPGMALLQRPGHRGRRGVVAVSAPSRPGLREAIGVGLREWKTVAVLLWANWLIAALMIFPMLTGVFSAWGHAPRAVGKPLISPPLLLHLGSLVEAGNRPSTLAPILFLLVL